jgi:cephalosporin-C deacetylase
MKRFFSFILFLVLLATSGMANTAAAPGQVEIGISPTEKSGIFNYKKRIKYKLDIKNGTKVDQVGTLYYELKSVDGESLLERTFDINIPSKKAINNDFEIPFETPGAYLIKFTVVLNKVKREFNFSFDFVTGEKPDKAAERAASKNSKEMFDAELDGEMEGEIKITMKPGNIDGIFVGRSNIHYDVNLQNTYKLAQTGTIGYQIKDAIHGKIVSEKIFDIKLAKRSSKRLSFNISPPVKPGIYNIEVAVNTTTYDDTTHYTFGYEIGQMTSPFHRPDDFDDFWKAAMEELATVNPAYKIEEDFEKSTAKHKVYRVEMSSLDDVRIYGWLSIPTTLLGSKFPVLVGYSGYHVMLKPLYFDEFASFMLNARGADKEAFKELNPENIEMIVFNVHDPMKYIYRSMYMDCIRAVDFIFANEDMGFDLKRVAVFGGSQGGSLSLMVAGLLGSKIQTCMADNPTYCDFHLNMEMQDNIREESFIIKNFNRYLDENKNTISKDDLLNNLSYFEIQNFAPKIKCSVLLGIGLLDPLAPAVTTIGMYNKLNPEVIKMSEIYTFPELAHEVPDRHNTFKSIWFYEKLAKGKK